MGNGFSGNEQEHGRAVELKLYDEIIQLLMELNRQYPGGGYDSRALYYFEKKQGRKLLQIVGKSMARHYQGVPAEILAKERDILSRFNAFSKGKGVTEILTAGGQDKEKMQALVKERERLTETIRQNYPEYYALKHPEPATLKILQEEVLASDETIFIYGLQKGAGCLWIINREQLVMLPLAVTSNELRETIGKIRKKVSRIEKISSLMGMKRALRGSLDQTGEYRTLYQQLIPEAARPYLAETGLLFIVPTGPLFDLPFEALVAQVDDRPRYLVEDIPVAYLSSGSLLDVIRKARARKRTKAGYPYLAFADPLYDSGQAVDVQDNSVLARRAASYVTLNGGQFTRLPKTGAEALAIKNILAAPDSSNPVYLRAEASKSTLLQLSRENRLDDYQHILFACHGILPGETDTITQPALVLSQPDPKTKKPDFLTMGDVFGLTFNADLITLSACNSGQGKRQKGEGVTGLTKAFMYAGTPAVAVTQWSVNDEAEMMISIGMFEEINRSVPLARALQRAKVELIQGKNTLFRQPYFWAPLVLFGDGAVRKEK
jgi:CHAT domain-containing protein